MIKIPHTTAFEEYYAAAWKAQNEIDMKTNPRIFANVKENKGTSSPRRKQLSKPAMTVNNLLKHGMEREDIAKALQMDEVDVIILINRFDLPREDETQPRTRPRKGK